MTLLNFAKTEKDAITQKVQEYFAKELDQEIGKFEAGFLVEFLRRRTWALLLQQRASRLPGSLAETDRRDNECHRLTREADKRPALTLQFSYSTVH